jgi:predicted ATPase/DNA-binding XRE family transcriptional regulator
MPASTQSRFGELLRQHRLAAGLTQEALAERAGLSVHGIQKLERGVTHPYRETTQRLSVGLRLAPDEDAHLRNAGEPEQRRPTARARRTRRTNQHNLPVPLTSFIGREREQVEVARLLATSRLVTLTGTGGVGKTRLALEVARTASAAFRDGVAFVSFAALSDARFVPATIAQAVGVRELGGRPLQEGLLDFLRDRHTLFVLDNCEHVLGAAPQLAQLLAECPQLTVLATSRSSLRLSGEHEFRVRPLALPRTSTEPRHAPTGVSKERPADAMLLFLARARAAGATFPLESLTEADATTVRAICVRLQGLPLALELAAARTKLLSLSTLSTRLERQLDVLTHGPTDVPARQQTLRATLDWSYALLTPKEQRLFGLLAVFAGGVTLEAAEAVCQSPGEPPDDVFNGLSGLTDHGLVQPAESPGGPTRFEMLAVVREYALERSSDDEHQVVRRNHAAYYAALVEEADPHLLGPHATRWFARLDAEAENIRAALAWSGTQAGREADGVETGLRLTSGLWFYWDIRGRYTESRSWLEAFLEAAQTSDMYRPTPAFVRALIANGKVACRFGQLKHARLISGRALTLARRLHLRREAAMATIVLADEAFVRGALDAARRRTGDALTILGKEPHAAPDRWLAGFAELQLGEAARMEGDTVQAAAHFSRSVRCYRQLRDGLSVARPLLALVHIALGEGDTEAAAARAAEVCSTIRSAPAMWLAAPVPLATFLSACAGLAMLQDQPRWAATLLGSTSELLRGIETALEPADRTDRERYATEAGKRLGHAAFAEAWAQGQAGARGLVAADVTELVKLVVAGLPSYRSRRLAERSTG